MAKMDLSIVIPAKNEGKKIEKDIREASYFLKKEKLVGEILIVTDGLKDSTNPIVEKLSRHTKTIRLVLSKGAGKGFAVKAGVLKAKGKIVMFVDTGCTIPYSAAKRGIDLLENGYDIAIGSRRIKGSKIVWKAPVIRRAGSRFFYFLIHFVGIPSEIKDTQCGFKIYKASVARSLFGSLQTRGWMFDIELLLRAKRKGLQVGQFPVSWSPDKDSRYKIISGTLRNMKEIMLIKLKLKL